MVDRTNIPPHTRLHTGFTPLLQWYPLIPPYNHTGLPGRLPTRILQFAPPSRAQLAQTRQLNPRPESGINAAPISNPHLPQPLVSYDGSISRISWDSRERLLRPRAWSAFRLHQARTELEPGLVVGRADVECSGKRGSEGREHHVVSSIISVICL